MQPKYVYINDVKKLIVLLLCSICTLSSTTKITPISPEHRYNLAAKALLSAIEDMNNQYDRLALAANTMIKVRNNSVRYLDVRKPAAPLEQLKQQAEQQIKLFHENTKNLEDCAKELKNALYSLPIDPTVIDLTVGVGLSSP